MEISHEIIINSTSEKIWDVIAQKFGDVQDWLSMISSSKVTQDGKLIDNAPCSGRICMTNYGKVEETITQFDEDNLRLSYNAKAEKLPFFVKDLVNTWNITSIENNKNKVTVNFKMKIDFPFNLFVSFLMKSQMNKTMRLSLEELKYFVETDKSLH